MPNPRRGEAPKKKASPKAPGKTSAGAKRAAVVVAPPQFTEINVIGTRPRAPTSICSCCTPPKAVAVRI
jgi:hypothetical protein